MNVALKGFLRASQHMIFTNCSWWHPMMSSEAPVLPERQIKVQFRSYVQKLKSVTMKISAAHKLSFSKCQDFGFSDSHF